MNHALDQFLPDDLARLAAELGVPSTGTVIGSDFPNPHYAACLDARSPAMIRQGQPVQDFADSFLLPWIGLHAGKTTDLGREIARRAISAEELLRRHAATLADARTARAWRPLRA